MNEDATVSLREYLEHLFSQHERAHVLLRQALDTADATTRDTLERYIEVHDREHETMRRALDKAAAAIDERLANMNEFRLALTDLTAKFPPRELLDAMVAALETRLATYKQATDSRLISIERMLSDISGRMLIGGAVFGVLAIALQVVGAWLLR